MGQHEVDLRAMYDGKYIGAWDLKGRDVNLTIKRVVQGELPKIGERDKKDRMPLLYFEGTEKAMCVNKTNLATIGNIAGGFKAAQWIGVRITVYATTCKLGRNIVDCVRVRPTSPKSSAKDAPIDSAPPEVESEPGDDDGTPLEAA